MKTELKDIKHPLIYAFWSTVNALVLRNRFQKIKVVGSTNLPEGPFFLVANHVTRWDGLLLYHMLDRPANFMVSPNELKGLQGAVLTSMGSFPATVNRNLQSHVQKQIAKNEPVVVFPEGDVFRDGTTHQFKTGVARLALGCLRAGIDVPIVPAAIRYVEDERVAVVAVAPAVRLSEYLNDKVQETNTTVRALTDRLRREVCHLRYQLGARGDEHILFSPAPQHSWSAITPA